MERALHVHAECVQRAARLSDAMTDSELNQPHLPRTFHVEQFHSGDVQKRQDVEDVQDVQDMQDDGCLARRLQDEEEERAARLSHALRQLAARDCEYAKMIQEQLRRHEEEKRRREEEDEEMARHLQEDEELQIRRHREEAGCYDDSGPSPLSKGLEAWGQVRRDAELARRLQEEEDRQPRREQVEVQNLPRERLNSEGLSSPVEEPVLDPHRLGPQRYTLGAHSVHNIAEELDPTFNGRKRENRRPNIPSGILLAPRTPHSIFYDYLPEPAFAPPTRRHGDQSGGDRATRARCQNCKQQ
ncbi:vicilin-like seed storage protein At2g18540 isoform X1 [Electrophorus electricus]|uniref:vicilin-like seed storage protein At2g18540 isoform X1 n=1 Tax=Electrophorus electricus TaxID=8005 RepID=UPI0015D02344|nr:vicilin-like seed storage protein At2g18540 isoform X1 [Electrophorus electricus]